MLAYTNGICYYVVMMNKTQKVASGIGGTVFIAWILLLISAIPAWITHIIWIVSNLGADNVVAVLLFGLFALFVAPVGIVHGWALWFGGGDWIHPVYTKAVVWMTDFATIGVGA